MKNNIVLLKKSLFIIAASFMSSIALNMFIIPHKLLSGGVSGIALIVQYLAGIPAGYIILLLNIPLFILSIKELDKEFTFLTILGTLCQSTFLILTRNISKVYVPSDMILSCIYGGVIHGTAIGIIFSNHGSLGGTDIISMIIRRKTGQEIGRISFAMNLLIVCIGSMFFGLERGLYTLVSMYIVSTVLDRVLNGFDRKKLLLIITEKEELVTERIQDDLNRGCTFLYGLGAYTKAERRIIYCAVSLSQLPKVKAIVEQLDPYAFMTIIDASEVQGKGFKKAV